jgi:hypothetical protein
MATAVQIQVTLSDTGVVSGINNYKASFKDLSAAANQAKKDLSDALAQMGSAAEAGNVQAQKILQGYHDEVARTEAALKSYRSSAAEAAVETEALTQAVSHQVPMMAAASGAVRELNGNLSVRAAERFLATTLQLGPALQAAFPVIGAIAMISVVDELAEKLSQLIADTLIYTQAEKDAFDHQLSVNKQVADLDEKIHQLKIEHYTDEHSAADNAAFAINAEIQKRQGLQKLLADTIAQQNEARKHTQDTDTYSTPDGMVYQGLGKSAEEAQARVTALDATIGLLRKQIEASDAQNVVYSDHLRDAWNKEAEQAQKKAEEGARAWSEAWQKASNEAKAAWDKFNTETNEQEKLFNTFENDRLKETDKENKDSLDRRTRDTVKALHDEQTQWKEQERAYQQYTQHLGDDLYQAFNDITSGRIGTLIKQGFERLFANILAQWITTVRGIGDVNTHGGAGGLFASMLGSIFGIGGSSSGASGPYGLPAGVASNFDGGAFDNTDSFPAGAGISLGSLGSGSLSTAAIGGVLSSIPSSPAPVGGAGTVPKQSGGVLSGISSLLSNPGKLGMLATLAGIGLALSGPNKAIAGGAGIGALLGYESFANPALAGSLAFLSPVSAGLIGYGVGSQHGPAAGAASGFGSGFLTGFLATGNPIFGLISGAIGGLVGLFSGLFGGSPSKHSQADKYINANILPVISQEVTNYEGFRTDFATSINDLEAMRQNSYATLKQQFGTDATNDEWGRLVVPAINTAEDRIRSDETERQRRGTLLFGPPQFAVGGIFTAPNPGGAGLAVLHDKERVMTSAATRMYGSELAQMEANARSGVVASASQTTIVINLQAWDGKSVDSWLRNGGIAKIQNAARRRGLEGH